MIGIIGFGRFGRLTASYLSKDFEVSVASRSATPAQVERCGAVQASLEAVCRQKIVIICVPISAMEALLKKIAPMMSASSIVMDVCSVKVYPVQWMEALLPPEVSYLPTHPMFGPDSATDTLTGKKIVLCKGRIGQAPYEKIKHYLLKKGLDLVEATAEAHDRKIAVSLGLTHFIGRALAEFGAVPLDIDTEGYQRLLHILEVVENDTWQLFMDMHAYNPYAEEIRHQFIRAVEDIQTRLVS